MTYYVSTHPYNLARRWAASLQNQEAVRSLPVDVRDEGEAFVLTAFVPGLKAEDLNIQVVEDTLTIEGKFGNQEGEYLLSELPAGTFRRSLRLPSTLDAANASANIENGILSLRVPRSEEARPRTIPVASK
ncbi:MAG TPA: Hsp20/alpha crystallin family protein [Anaerolineales bacterium]|jgi:HSP20 family protein